MGCPQLENLPIIPPSPTPVAPNMLQPGDFDYTIDDPGFANMLQNIVGNAGDDSDGIDTELLDLAAGIAEADAAVTVFDTIIDILDPTLGGLDGFDLSPEIEATGTGKANISADIDALATIIGETPPGPVTGGGGTGTQSPPTSYNDTLDFPDEVIPPYTDVGLQYTWQNNTGADQDLSALAVVMIQFDGKKLRNLVTAPGPIQPHQPAPPPSPPPVGEAKAASQAAGGVCDPTAENCTWYCPDFVPGMVAQGASVTWTIHFSNPPQPGLYEIGWGPQNTAGAVVWTVYSKCNVTQGG